jgi:glycosyltransferase involved in cell wall biosynthesis
MRLGIITPGFSASEQDWCIPWLLNYTRLLSTCAQVDVFSLHYPPDRAQYKTFGATIHSLGISRSRVWPRWPEVARAAFEIQREHRLCPFDALHAMWAGEPGLVALLVRKLTGVPVILSVLGGELKSLPEIGYGLQENIISRMAVRYSMKGAQKLVVGSTQMEELCKDVIGRKEYVARIPIGVDASLFCPGGNHHLNGKHNVLCIGSLVPVKNQRVLLEAVASAVVRDSSLQLTIVGEGPEEHALSALATRLGISERVTFTGKVEHDSLVEYYQDADVLAVSSLHESQCMVALEALACGVPLVGFRVGILADLPFEICRTVEPGDIEGFAGVLVQTLNRLQTRRRETTQLARRVVEENYTLELMVERMLDLYEEVSQRQVAR